MPIPEPKGDVGDPAGLEPESLGFMCGIEIHQQLSTGKLHSRQQSLLYDRSINDVPLSWKRTRRKLRAGKGEGGKIDVAASFEEKRNRTFIYIQTPNSGLIELDEAPPLPPDPEALNASLKISAMLRGTPASYLQIMRKTVVDGSNTSGFQRTALVATGGSFEVDGKSIGISVICLEEDSARKMGEEITTNGTEVTFSLDRLGIPLIEIATDPDISTPEHAKAVCQFLGMRLRDTRDVRRGLGSIRQDLNVSISSGDRVEIKGCQDLDWIPRIIRIEMARQLHFYRLANELRAKQGFTPLPPDRDEDNPSVENEISRVVKTLIPGNVSDVTKVFGDIESGIIRSGIEAGHGVYAIALQGMNGMIGPEKRYSDGTQIPRLGRELSGAAKRAGVKGIIHSDETPAYGIEASHVRSLRTALSLSPEDAFVLCIAPDWQAHLALDSVLSRARQAYHRIPKEVRNVVVRKGQPEDGSTMPMRPLPGGARMYPETDIPLLEITSAMWDRATKSIPLTRDQRLSRLHSTGLSESQSDAILGLQMDDLIVDCARGKFLDLPSMRVSSIATALLDQTIQEASKIAGISPEEFPLISLVDTIYSRDSGEVTRDGVVSISALHASSRDLHNEPFSIRMNWIKQQAEALGVVPADSESVEIIVSEVISQNSELIQTRGNAAMGTLMGIIMKKMGGAADGKLISQILREKLKD